MKKHIAISGNLGKRELKVSSGTNMVEWVGEINGGYQLHFASRWKETSTTVYYKWWY